MRTFYIIYLWYDRVVKVEHFYNVGAYTLAFSKAEKRKGDWYTDVQWHVADES